MKEEKGEEKRKPMPKAEPESREDKYASMEACRSWIRTKRASRIFRPFLKSNSYGGKIINLLIKFWSRFASKHSKALDKIRITEICTYSWDKTEAEISKG